MSSPDSETTGDTATAAPTEAESGPSDELRAGLVATFERELGTGPSGVVATHIRPGDDVWIRVAAEQWQAAHEIAKTKLECQYFGFLSGLDWLPSPWGRYEDAEVDNAPAPHPDPTGEVTRGYTGGDTRFQVFTRVTSVTKHYGITLLADVPADTMAVDSLIPVYAGADWHEREAWEMFGITFTGHPNLQHIYLPGEFEGNPLRKDFPLLARIVKPWPGIVDVEPMPGEDDGEGEGESAEGGDA